MADTETHLTESAQEVGVRFKYTTHETSFVVTDIKSDENISLQDAFRRYREAKQDELRQARLIRKRQELRKADPEKMAALRQKFLNQAKKYYGYPYAKKYWPPDSPEYKSKLFLDCCGLVRRVMRDLADDFGFIIGPWNQSYMFDTLPIIVENEKDMKPGDLVFISATYYNPKSRKQRHNMTHVEIWSGEGCKTIGARWNNGKVQTWNSYAFLAKSYHSEAYHFRSIDTWLKGLCTSHCSQHSWKRRLYNPTKKSIFALPQQIDEDEAAGDDDNNVDSFNMRGNTFCNQITGVSRMLSQCKVSELERPKTELDLPTVRIDSPRSGSKSAEVHGEFPTIRNDLKGKGKRLVNKKKKAKNGFEKNSKETTVRTIAEKDKVHGAASKAFAAEEGDSQERTKELAQLSISGSLNDLGRKSLYLKDLVDSQKKRINDIDYDDDIDAEEDIYLEEEKEGESEEQESEDDDDYFINVDNDRENEDTEHSDDSSHFIMGEDIDTDIDRETECGQNEVDLIREVGDTVHTTAEESKNADNVTGVKAEKSVEASKVEIEANISGNQRIIDDKIDESENVCIFEKNYRTCGEFEHYEAADISCKEMTEVVTVRAEQKCNKNKGSNDAMAVTSKNACIVPYEASAGDVRVESIEQKVKQYSLNQNTNSKTSDISHFKEKSRGQFLKASVVTMVSPSVPSNSPSKSVMSSENRTSQPDAQSTGSGSSQATGSPYVTKSSTGAC